MIMHLYWRKKKDKACRLVSSVAFVNGRCPYFTNIEIRTKSGEIVVR